MENKENKVTPLGKTSPDKVDISELVGMVGDFLMSNIDKQNAQNLKIAEINKPITEKQLELQELGLRNQHEAWTKVTDAQIAKDRREFTTGSVTLGGILLFLMIAAFVLLYKGEYQYALSIITLLIGFVGGYSVDKQNQKRQENKQS